MKTETLKNGIRLMYDENSLFAVNGSPYDINIEILFFDMSKHYCIMNAGGTLQIALSQEIYDIHITYNIPVIEIIRVNKQPEDRDY